MIQNNPSTFRLDLLTIIADKTCNIKECNKIGSFHAFTSNWYDGAVCIQHINYYQNKEERYDSTLTEIVPQTCLEEYIKNKRKINEKDASHAWEIKQDLGISK